MNITDDAFVADMLDDSGIDCEIECSESMDEIVSYAKYDISAMPE